MLVDPVARPYAEALFEIAKQQSQVDEIGQELSEFRGLVEREAEMAAFLASPVIEPSVKSGHLRKAIDGRVSDTVANTLCLLVDKGRFDALGRIVDAYLSMADEHAGRVRVSVKTAVPMSEALKQELATTLRTGLAKTIELETEVDSDMMGGAMVAIGDKVYDGSLRNQLNRFRQQISRRAGNEDQG